MQQWRKNLYVLVIGQFFTRLGQTFIVPYIPIFINEDLKVDDPKAVAFWAGLIAGSLFLGQFIASPIWGYLADKLGRKIMILRASFVISLFMFITAFISNVYEFFIIRFIMGCFSGFNAAAVTFIAYEMPKEKLGYSMGFLQTGQMAGLLIGPAIGGFLAHFLGYRFSFILASIISFFNFLMLLFGLTEKNKTNIGRKADILEKFSLRKIYNDLSIVKQSRMLFIIFFIILITQLSIKSIEPELALFVKSLYTGNYLEIMVSLTLIAVAVTNVFFAPILGKLSDIKGAHNTLFLCLFFTSIIFALHCIVTNIKALILLRFFLGLGIAGILPSANTLISEFTINSNKGSLYGISASINALGNFAGPFLGGIILSVFNIELGFIIIFILVASLFLLSAIFLKLNLVNSR